MPRPGRSGPQSARLRALAWRRLRRSRTVTGALVFLLVLVAAVVAAPIVAPYSPIEMRTTAALTAPSPDHWMGTDQFGRDILSRVIYGGRVSLLVGITSVAISVAVGVPMGLVAGYFGRGVETAIMRFTDILLAFPGVLLALGIVTALGPGVESVIVAVGVSGIPHFLRVVRSSTLSVRENLYVEAARVAGCSDGRIISRHILPNVAAPVIILATLGLATAILNGAALSFLGLGPQVPTPEWGAMLSAGRDYLRQAAWIMTFPGLAIMATVLAVNVVGDGLRDALDPRLIVE